MPNFNVLFLLATLITFGINLNAQTTTTLLPESLQYKYNDNLDGILQYLRFNNQQNTEESFLRLKNYFTDGDILIEANRRTDIQSNTDLFLRSNEIYMNTDVGTGGAGFTRLFINQAGRVGVGNTSPLRLLDVSGDIALTNLDRDGMNIEFIESSGTKAIMNWDGQDLTIENNESGNANFFLASNDDIAFQTGLNDNIRMLVDQDGRVGINTINPQRRLDVVGDIALSAGAGSDIDFIEGTNVRASINWDGDDLIISNEEVSVTSGSTNDILLETENGGISFYTGGNINERMRINENGDIGIGTTNIPTGYRLAVDGQVIAERVRVRLSQNWPDYVFAKDYELMSLPKLRKYVEINKHLPNLPNAEEVTKNGQDLGDIQIKLLKKIEELTLYLLRQQEQIEQQQAQIIELKNQSK